MFLQTIFSWFLLFLYLAPLLLVGILIFRRISLINRFELLIPAGCTLGITVFSFFINIYSQFARGGLAIYLAYLTIIIIGVFLSRLQNNLPRISFPSRKYFLPTLASIIGWTAFIFWKGKTALIGSDTNLYYSIAHTFIKGNFPPLTPWQPDLPLAYHLGTSQLLGAFYLFTGINFQFLHLFFSALFILCSSQILIWIWDRSEDLLSILFANLAGAVSFISFGFFYLVIPRYPFNLPVLNNLNQLVIFLRNLPTVNQALEVYGAPINLDALFYFIFHAYGIAIFLLIVTLLTSVKKASFFPVWYILVLCLATLALVNESIFLAVAPAVFIGLAIIEKKQRTLMTNFLKLLILGLFTVFLVLLPGGIITSLISNTQIKEASVVIFPKKNAIKENFLDYHHNQEISKLLPLNKEYGSFYWFHIGVDILLIANVLILTTAIFEFRQFFILLSIFISGLSSLLAYNILVPRFLIANGNRFLSFSFLAFSIIICSSLIYFFKKSKLHKKILIGSFILWLFIPTIIPPLALLSKTRFGENKFVPKQEESSYGLEWMKINLPYDSRTVVLDSRAPHPSGMARAMIVSGVFAPIFPGEFRAYTIEASPEYFDIAYYLSPSAMRKLKINIVFIDNVFYLTLPEIRKQNLREEKYFDKIFDNSEKTKNWEKIYRIKNNYLVDGAEIEGTFDMLRNFSSYEGKVYIDKEENLAPPYLRRALIFTLRDKDLYYLPESGVYLNVESNIRENLPLDNGEYDYLILGKNTRPEDICKCKVKLIWKGIKDEVLVWKKFN